MNRIGRAAARWAARLIPARRRAWAEALWAEDLDAEEAQPDLVGAVGVHAGPL